MEKSRPGDEPVPVLVWDLPLRATHWGIALCFATSWATHELGSAWFDWHRRSGYLMLVLVAFRIGWGFTGPRHARFSSFVRGPRAVLDAIGGLRKRTPGGSAGHNALGAVSVLAMLLSLLFQAVTGLFANDEILNAGPLYGHVGAAVSDRLTSLHKANFDVLAILVGLHLAAILFYAVWKRSNLVPAMWTGRKLLPRDKAGLAITGQRLWLAVILAALLAAALAWAVSHAPPAELSWF